MSFSASLIFILGEEILSKCTEWYRENIYSYLYLNIKYLIVNLCHLISFKIPKNVCFSPEANIYGDSPDGTSPAVVSLMWPLYSIDLHVLGSLKTWQDR